MASTDFLGLDGHEIFGNVRETLPKNIKKTLNVLAIRDDVLYTWDFQDNCVLTLNVRAARGDEAGDIVHQTLLPQSPPLFTPDVLLVNESNTLVAIVGPNGVLVIELPARYPPYGAFDNNKELIYCRSHSLHERMLAFSSNVEVRQVRFHPGSVHDSHVLMLTSDNLLRLYDVDRGSVRAVGVYAVGVQPMGRFPTTKTTYLEALGDIAIDFDFGPPELKNFVNNDSLGDHVSNLYAAYASKHDGNKSQITKVQPNQNLPTYKPKPNQKATSNKRVEAQLHWPIYVLFGNGDVFLVEIELGEKAPSSVKGPLPILPDDDENYGKSSCSILCVHSTPPVICVANCNGTIYHAVVLPSCEPAELAATVDEDEHREELPNYVKRPDRALYVFESVELELGLATASTDVEYSCPIFLHKNLGKVGHYFATHEAGVHSVNIPCVDDLHKFVGDRNATDPDLDLFDEASAAEYLVCTKTSTSDRTNPVIGFAIYYEPPSVLVLLANGQLVTLSLTTLMTLSAPDSFDVQDLETMNTPLKKMLSEPFNQIIQRILKQSTTQPILKLSSSGEHNQQECYELLQRAAQIFRDEHFKNHNRAREEIEKRVRTLTKLKQIQRGDIQRLSQEKQMLQDKAGNLAEKYEDIKDKQEELMKRCEKLLILISKRQAEPSFAENNFLKELNDVSGKVETYKKAISKLRHKISYQDIQMKNWNRQNEKENVLGSVQTEAVKTNLQNMTDKIAGMIKEVNEYKQQLNLK